LIVCSIVLAKGTGKVEGELARLHPRVVEDLVHRQQHVGDSLAVWR